MKLQAGIMEYIFMTLFVIFVIALLVLFLGWWNIMHIGTEHARSMDDKALFLAKYLMVSPFFVKEKFVFDDSLLTGMKRLESSGKNVCRELDEILGSNWYFEVKIADGEEENECTQFVYPDCNYWSFCKPKSLEEERIAKYVYTFPVNVYRHVTQKHDLALLTVGVYE